MRAVLVDPDRLPASPSQRNGKTACSKEGRHRLVVMPTARLLSLFLKRYDRKHSERWHANLKGESHNAKWPSATLIRSNETDCTAFKTGCADGIEEALRVQFLRPQESW